jgi:hypothetical protein
MRSTNILIILVALNASAVLVGSIGLGAEAGYNPTVGGDDRIEEANQSASNVEGSGGVIDSFVGAVLNAASQLVTIFSVVVAGPQMLLNLGVPGPIVALVAAPLYIVVGIDLLEVISGRQLT